MRVRPLYRVLLLAALAGLVAYLVVPPAIGRRDRAALRRARALAAAFPDPRGATARPPGDCHGDDVVRCTLVHRPVDDVAAEAEAWLRARGAKVRTMCDTLPHLNRPDIVHRDCLVGGETGHGHVVFVHVMTNVVRVAGEPRVSGTRVDVSAG